MIAWFWETVFFVFGILLLAGIGLWAITVVIYRTLTKK